MSKFDVITHVACVNPDPNFCSEDWSWAAEKLSESDDTLNNFQAYVKHSVDELAFLEAALGSFPSCSAFARFQSPVETCHFVAQNLLLGHWFHFATYLCIALTFCDTTFAEEPPPAC